MFLTAHGYAPREHGQCGPVIKVVARFPLCRGPDLNRRHMVLQACVARTGELLREFAKLRLFWFENRWFTPYAVRLSIGSGSDFRCVTLTRPTYRRSIATDFQPSASMMSLSVQPASWSSFALVGRRRCCLNAMPSRAQATRNRRWIWFQP